MEITVEYLNGIRNDLASLVMYNEVLTVINRQTSSYERKITEMEARLKKGIKSPEERHKLLMKQNMRLMIGANYKELLIDLNEKKARVIERLAEYLTFLHETGHDAIEESIQDEQTKVAFHILNQVIRDINLR